MERRHIYRVEDDRSRRLGVEESRHQMRDDGCVQDGGVVCHHGGVDSRPSIR